MTDNRNHPTWFESGMVEFANARYDKSIEMFTKAIEGDDGSALAYVSRGAARLKLAKARDAKDDFDRAIALDAGYARAYHLRGIAHEQIGELARAFQDFDRLRYRRFRDFNFFKAP